MQTPPTQTLHLSSRVFLFLVAYRWASLLPGLWLLTAQPQALLAPVQIGVFPLAVLAVVVSHTLLITLFNRQLNQHLLRMPALLLVDMVFVVALLAISGGTHSPYYLYALSPVLAGAFFFQMRGAILSAAVFTPLFLAAAALTGRITGTVVELDLVTIQTAGIWLIAVLLGYPSVLLKRLRRTSDELTSAHDALADQNKALAEAHRQLEIIHELTTSLQAAPDVLTVQQRVLEAVTRDLGYNCALLGLLNPINERLEGWRGATADQSAPPGKTIYIEPLDAVSLSMEASDSPLITALVSSPEPFTLSSGAPRTGSPAMDRWLEGREWYCCPLVLRDHPIGLLILQQDSPPASQLPNAQRMELLRPVASQAAVALGTTMLCIDRAQRLAVERERNRIARDIHDTVAQSLFGVTFTLDACINMLPESVDQVRSELVQLRDQASQVRTQVRQSIFDLWPANLALERLKSDLRMHASQCCQARAFRLDFTTRGDFEVLSPRLRQTLFQIAQEAVANAAHHAGTDSAQVIIQVDTDEVTLQVEDRGQGYDPSTIQPGKYGLRGIQERVSAIGGTLQITSSPGEGSSLLVHIPRLPGAMYV
jgi:signal transduction histidine kinase